MDIYKIYNFDFVYKSYIENRCNYKTKIKNDLVDFIVNNYPLENSYLKSNGFLYFRISENDIINILNDCFDLKTNMINNFHNIVMDDDCDCFFDLEESDRRLLLNDRNEILKKVQESVDNCIEYVRLDLSEEMMDFTFNIEDKEVKGANSNDELIKNIYGI